MTPSKSLALEVILDKAIDERLEAAQIGDAGALRQLRSNLNSILLGTSLPRALRVRVINQIATCDLDLGDLGIFDNLTESQDRITHILSKPFGGDSTRQVLLANLLYLCKHSINAYGDIDAARRTVLLLRKADRESECWPLIENALYCIKTIVEQDPQHETEYLDMAVEVVLPVGLVDIDVTSETIGTLFNGADVYSSIAEQSGDSRYMELSISLLNKVLSFKDLDEDTEGKASINKALNIVKRLELKRFNASDLLHEADLALQLARHGAGISQALGTCGEARAIDLECLAHCLNTAATIPEGNLDLDLLEEGLAYADQSLKEGPEGLAWSRHAGVKIEILSNLARIDHQKWHAILIEMCRTVREAGYSSPEASTHLGRWLTDGKNKAGDTGYWELLEGAQQYTNASARISALIDIFARVIKLEDDEGGDWLLVFIPALLQAFLENYRGTMWSALGKEHTREMAGSLSWIGAVWADLVLTTQQDWSEALSGLSVVANALWIMDADQSISTDEDSALATADPFAATRRLLKTSAQKVIPGPFGGSELRPTLIVIIPGSEHGWALIRSASAQCEVVPLPNVSRELSVDINSSFDGDAVDSWTRRGHTAAPKIEIAKWIEKSIMLPIEQSGIDLGGWVVWCPTGPAIGLPLHCAPSAGVACQSYVTDPLFTPASLKTHNPSRKKPEASFIGWSEYDPAEWQKLGGVLREATAFEQVVKGATFLNRPLKEVAINASVLLHIACHGEGESADGEAVLQLGFEGIGPDSILGALGGQRDLVLLNACLTASPAARLPDHNLTIAKAFQVAGARSVIGSLWSVADGDLKAPRTLPEVLIDSIYGRLFKGPHYCMCEHCVALVLSGFVGDLGAMGTAWKDRQNWVHIIA